MRQIDEIHLAWSFYGSRKIRDELWDRGYDVGRDRVRRLMRLMGIEAIYVKPRLSAAHPGHKNRICCEGFRSPGPTTYGQPTLPISPWQGGFAILWRLLTGPAGWCCPGGCPTRWTVRSAWRSWKRLSPSTAARIYSIRTRAVSSAQRPLLSASVHTVLQSVWTARAGGETTSLLNVSGKASDIYLKAYGSMAEVKKGLTDYFTFYNQKRWHQSLGRKTPAMIYFGTNPQRQVAA